MFAARADQENFVHGQQQAAAAKPLNQGVRGLGAKTPGNKAPKTPFRRPLNDENDDFAAKTGLKTGKKGGDTLFTKGQKGPDLDKNAFLTPAGPRNRAPLGMKTTNAKAGMLKTPNAQTEAKSAQKTVSPRLRRAKVKIHQAETVRCPVQNAEPDIEYMAPRSVPLPDYPDDLHEQDYSMLQGANLTNGWFGHFSNPTGESLETRRAREQAAATKAGEELIARALAADGTSTFDFALAAAELDSKKKASSRAPSTITSKRAAAALSRPASTSTTSSKPRVPSFAAPTATATARRTTPAPDRKPSSSSTATNTSLSRHAVASAASKSTLGYSAGRAVSATARQPLSSIYKSPVSNSPGKLSKQAELLESLIADDPELEALLRERNGGEEEKLVESMAGTKLDEVAEDEEEEEDELKDFQFVIPE